MSYYTYEQINDVTAFADGEPFDSEAAVRKYFTVANMEAMFSPVFSYGQDTLDAMAGEVLKHRWNMTQDAVMNWPRAS